jgi:hypothetical protein
MRASRFIELAILFLIEASGLGAPFLDFETREAEMPRHESMLSGI